MCRDSSALLTSCIAWQPVVGTAPMPDDDLVRITVLPERVARRSRRSRRIGLLTSFGGAFGSTGLVGLLSRGPMHHPVFDTACAILGVEAAVLGLYLHYRRPNVWL